jgi:hypothetical protein
MQRTFIVLRSRGPAWDDAKPMNAQPDWASHGAFMDRLCDVGLVALGGPLEGTRDVLLVCHAEGAAEIADRLASDPWTISGLLVTTQISSWQIRLGTLEP